jgi:hypothetical protein
LSALLFAGTLVATALLAACNRANNSAPDNTPQTSVRDSAGVRIVSAGFSRDSLRDSEALRVLDTLLNGANAEAEGVVGLVALQPLADSSLVIFSQSGPALLRFPNSGRSRAEAIGKVGAEPGDFSARTTIMPYRPDTLLLWDWDVGRLTRVTAAGMGDATSIQYPLPRLATVSGAFHSGVPVAVTIAFPQEQGAGVSRADMALLRFGPDGAFRDTMIRLRGPERTVQLGRPGGSGDNLPVRSGSIPYGRTTLWTVGANSVLVHDTEGCEIARYDSTGTLRMRLDFSCVIEAVTPEDRERFLSEVLATARSRSDSAVRRRFVDEASFPPTKATASGLLTDPWDRIWLRLPVGSPTDDWVWWVFDAEGIPMTRLSLGRQWRIAAVRERDLIAVQTDRDDAPPVVVRMALPDALYITP